MCIKKIDFKFLQIFFIHNNMLLNDLLKLFSTNFDINEERFINIIESNNIKLRQRLLVNISNETKINDSLKNDSLKNDSLKNDSLKNDSLKNDSPKNDSLKNDSLKDDSLKNDFETNSKKKTDNTGRGRGRPRKTKEITEENDVIIEVEVITLEGKEYYKTSENVLMNKELEIEGILKWGKLLRSVK
jgi:pentapeptide MXKDX repeat protein